MIGLKIHNTWVDLLPNQTIKFDLQYLLLETDFIAGQKTFNFKLACNPKNQNLFGFPENIPAIETVNYFEAELYFKGVLLFVGKFALRKANQSYYEGNFMWGAADLVAHKDRLITEILKDWVYLFDPQQSADAVVSTSSLLATLDGTKDICFPTVKVGNNFHNQWKNGFYFTRTTLDGTGFLPMVRVVRVLQRCLEEIGYRLIDDFALKVENINRLIFWNTRKMPFKYTQIPFTFTQPSPLGGSTTVTWLTNELAQFKLYNKLFLAQFLPQMKFKELINLFRITFGLYPVVDSTHKTIKFVFYKEVMNPPLDAIVDYTAKVESFYEIEKEPWGGVTFSFKRADNDKLKEKEPLTWGGVQRIKPVQQYGQLPLGTPQKINQVVLVKELHRYYTYGNKNGNTVTPLHWSYCTTPIRYDGGEKNIEVPADTVQVSNELQFLGKGAKTYPYGIGTAQQYVMLYDIAAEKQVFITPAHVEFINSKFYPNGVAFGVRDDSPVSTRLLLEVNVNYSFSSDENLEWVRNCSFHRLLPQTDEPVGIDVTNKTPRVLFFYGLQPQHTPPTYEGSTDSSNDYPYAAPHPYNALGDKVGDVALRWEEEGGIVDTFYREYLSALKYAKKVKIKAKLALHEIMQFDPTKPIRIKESLFICEKVTFEMNNEILLAELELFRYAGNAVVPTFETPPTFFQSYSVHARGGFVPRIRVPTGATLTPIGNGAAAYQLLPVGGGEYDLVVNYTSGCSEAVFLVKFPVQDELPTQQHLSLDFSYAVSCDVIIAFETKLVNPFLIGGAHSLFRWKWANDPTDFNELPLQTWQDIEPDLLLMPGGAAWLLQVVNFSGEVVKIQSDFYDNTQMVDVIADLQQPYWRQLTKGLAVQSTELVENQAQSLYLAAKLEQTTTINMVVKMVDGQPLYWEFLRTDTSLTAGNQGAPREGLIVGLQASHVLRFVDRNNTPYAWFQKIMSSYVPFKDGVYQVVVLNKGIADGSTEDATIFVNGIRLNTTYVNWLLNPESNQLALLPAQRHYASSQSRILGRQSQGVFDKLQVQTGNLSAAQVRNLFNSNELNLTNADVLHYDFKPSNVTGTTLNDLSGNAYHATLNGTSMPTFVDLY